MRKLIMWNLVTLDGFFEGRKSWEIDWHEYAWGEEMEQYNREQTKMIGTVLFGRVTYEGMAKYWQSATGETAEFMNSIPKVVFSHTLTTAEWNNTRLVKNDVVEEITKLKQEPSKDIYIFGSAELSSTLMRSGLIDEYRLGLVPVVLGGGNPLFKVTSEQLKMRLLETRPLSTGLIILRYEAVR